MTDNVDANDMNKISAQHTDDIEEAPDPSGVADPSASDGTNDDTTAQADTTLRTYQDDLDTEFEATDPFIDEATEDPTEELQIPADEFKDELDKIAIDDLERGHDDMRETLEDRDESDDNSASAPQ